MLQARIMNSDFNPWLIEDERYRIYITFSLGFYAHNYGESRGNVREDSRQ